MKIIILDAVNLGDLSWDPLIQLGRLKIFDRMAATELLEQAADAQCILTHRMPIGRDIMDILTRLRYIGVLAAGHDHINTDYARRLGLPVTNIPDSPPADRVGMEAGSHIIKIAADNIEAWMKGEPINIVNGLCRGK